MNLYLTDAFQESFKGLDHYTQKMIKSWIVKNLSATTGRALTEKVRQYRIGDYRLICSIEDDKLTVLAITVGHRRDIYTS